MSIDVYIYDNYFNPLASTLVQIIVQDYKSRTILANPKQNEQKTGGLWGQDMNFSRGSFSYMISVDDSSGAHSSVCIYPMNGNENGRLDVVLYPFASPGPVSGSSPQTYNQIFKYISNQFWSEDEKIGVGMLVRSLNISREGWDSSINHWIYSWEERLVGLGIDPSLI